MAGRVGGRPPGHSAESSQVRPLLMAIGSGCPKGPGGALGPLDGDTRSPLGQTGPAEELSTPMTAAPTALAGPLLPSTGIKSPEKSQGGRPVARRVCPGRLRVRPGRRRWATRGVAAPVSRPAQAPSPQPCLLGSQLHLLNFLLSLPGCFGSSFHQSSQEHSSRSVKLPISSSVFLISLEITWLWLPFGRPRSQRGRCHPPPQANTLALPSLP